MTPVRLEPAALRSRVKHSTTEPLRSLYASAMSIIVIASGPNDSDNSIERMQPSMLIEVVLSVGSIHASSSPEMEYF